MDVAPPPAPGSRLHELGDSLLVAFRPLPQVGRTLFLAVWLVLWTAAGPYVFSMLGEADLAGRAFLVVWLCGWAVGECAVLLFLAWRLRGRQLLVVTPSHLEVRQELGRFKRVRRYEAALVNRVGAERVEADEDERPRRDYCLAIGYRGKSVQIGSGMGEREAEYVAACVLAKIRPRTRWTEGSGPQSPHPLEPEPTRGNDTSKRASRLVGLAVWIMFVAVTFVIGQRNEPDGVEPATSTVTGGFLTPPLPEDFSRPSEYAAAATHYVLTTRKTVVLGPVTCGEDVTWQRWQCRTKGVATAGPPAHVELTYLCSARESGSLSPLAVPFVACAPEFLAGAREERAHQDEADHSQE
jgi:hypothetical protein